MNTQAVLQNLATWVLWNSSAAAVLILLILAVRILAGRAMSPGLRSRLWLLVVVRLMLPLLPAVSFSSRVMPVAAALLPQVHEAPRIVSSIPQGKPPKTASRIEPDSTPQFVVVEEGMVGMSAEPIPASQPVVIAEARALPKKVPTNWLRIALATWLAGAALLLGRTFLATTRLARGIRKLDPITDPKIVELLASSCELFRIRRIPRLLASENESAPALVGVIHPKILLPASLASKLSLDEIRLIFLHELAHLRRRDVLLNYLFAILTALHWFNPLLWIASWRMAADRELACDEAVLQVTSRRHARLYGCTILKLVELLNSQRLPAGAVGVVQHKALIQRRIDMIASYPSRTVRNSMLVRVAALSLATAAGVSAIRAQALPGSPTPPVLAPAAEAPTAIGLAPTPTSLPLAAPPRNFTAEEIATVSPKITMLQENIDNARLNVDALKRQGLGSNDKPLQIAADALNIRQQELKDYTTEWNQNYTIRMGQDGTPHSARKGASARLLASADSVSASSGQPVSPGVPASEAATAAGKSSALVAPGAAPAPIPAPGSSADSAPSVLPAPAPSALPGAGPATPPSVDPTANPSPGIMPVPPAAPSALPAAGDPAVGTDPNVVRPPALSPIPGGENPYAGRMRETDRPNGSTRQLRDPLNLPPNAGTPQLSGGGAIGGYSANRAENGTTQSVEDASARQANAEVMQKLSKNHAADFHGSVLRDALSYIADGSGIDVVIDERTISEVGVDVNSQPVTLHVGTKPMEQILSLTLRLASPQIDYSIYNGVVFVSSREALNRRIVTRIYDLPARFDRIEISQMITAAAETAKCNFFQEKIVVTAPEVAQRDVARLLAQIAPTQPGRQPAGTKAFFLFRLRTAKASEVAAQFPKELGEATADESTNSVLIATRQVEVSKAYVEKIDKVPQADDAVHTGPNNSSDSLAALKLTVRKARESRMHTEGLLLDLNRRENSGQQKIDPNFVELKRRTELQLSNAKQQENDAISTYEAALTLTNAKVLEDSLTMFKEMYGSDDPRVKHLEQQLAAARLHAVSEEVSAIAR